MGSQELYIVREMEDSGELSRAKQSGAEQSKAEQSREMEDLGELSRAKQRVNML